jgi:hypothetical protein
MVPEHGSTVALSHRKTTTAILRGILGPAHGQEARFARLAGRSVSWVKKVSAGLEPLTEEVALELESKTGISAAWLLRGDRGAKPLSTAGKPYSFALFEQHRAHLGSFPKMDFVSGALPAIAGIGAAAGERGKGSLFSYRLTRFLDECREEFGFDETAMAAVKAEIGRTDLAEAMDDSTDGVSEFGPAILDVHLL